jgi:hypothetical protein
MTPSDPLPTDGHGPLSDSGRERIWLRQNAAHSMMTAATSIQPEKIGQNRQRIHANKKVMRSTAAGGAKSPARTSRPALPTIGPRLSRSTCSQRRRRRTRDRLVDRHPHPKPRMQMIAILGKRSRGPSQTLLYNVRRPHSSLDGMTPDPACFTPLPLRTAA